MVEQSVASVASVASDGTGGDGSGRTVGTGFFVSEVCDGSVPSFSLS